jgi:hypothetical protein
MTYPGEGGVIMRDRFMVVLVLTVWLGIALRGSAPAETFTISDVSARTALYFTVPAGALKEKLPAPWQFGSVPAGPAKDANLAVIFIDQVLAQDPDGKPIGTGANRLMVLAAIGKNMETGESAPVIIGGFSADPANVPGAYKAYTKGTVTRERELKDAGSLPGTGKEMWEVRSQPTGSLAFVLQYQAAIPTRAKLEQKVYSGVESGFFRIYRIDQGSDVVKSTVTGVDRVQRYQFEAKLPEFAKLFDGSEKLVNITVIPWYVRQVFLP